MTSCLLLLRIPRRTLLADSRLALPARSPSTCTNNEVDRLASVSSPRTGTIPGELDQCNASRLERLKNKLYEAIRKPSYVRDMELIGGCIEDILRLPPSLHVFNIILKANIMLDSMEGVKSALQMIKEHGFVYNAITFNLLISYYRNSQCPLEAERLAIEMMERGIELSRVTHTTLVTAFARVDLEKAEKYFEMMKLSPSPHVHPDVYAYNAMIGSYMHHGQFSKSMALIEEMDKVGVLPNEITFKVLIYGLLRHGKKSEAWIMWETAEAVLPAMAPENISDICYQFFNHGEADQGIRILRRMEAGPSKADIRPSCIKAALRHAIASRDRDLFLHYFDGFVREKRQLYYKFLEARHPASLDWDAQIRDSVAQLLESQE